MVPTIIGLAAYDLFLSSPAECLRLASPTPSLSGVLPRGTGGTRRGSAGAEVQLRRPLAMQPGPGRDGVPGHTEQVMTDA